MEFCKLQDVIARERAQLWMIGGSGAGLVAMVTAIVLAFFSI